MAVQTAGLQSVVTDDGWRLTRFLKANEGQMFHLAADPGEQQNLYNDPQYAAKRQELFERLVAVSVRPNSIPRYRNLVDKSIDYLGPRGDS